MDTLSRGKQEPKVNCLLFGVCYQLFVQIKKSSLTWEIGGRGGGVQTRLYLSSLK